VGKRHPALIAIVFVFGLFLASVPFLFQAERSPYTEALALYDRMCLAIVEGDVTGFGECLTSGSRSLRSLDIAILMSRVKCVDRKASAVEFTPVPGRAWGPGRSYDLVIRPPGDRDPVRMRFMMEDDVLLWAPGKSIVHSSQSTE